MSICGNCPYPIEAELDGDPDKCQEYGCSFEDAAYKAQWAYDQLYARYRELIEENAKLQEKLLKYELSEDDLK